MLTSRPRVGHFGPPIDHIGPRVGHFGPPIDHIGPRVDHFGPRVSHFGLVVEQVPYGSFLIHSYNPQIKGGPGERALPDT